MTFSNTIITAMTGLLSAHVFTAVLASGDLEDSARTLSPYFVVLGDEISDGLNEPLPLKHTRVNVTISGIVADVAISQVYRNTGSRVLEAKYIFPASTRAAVHGLDMTIGDRILVAEIKEKEAARTHFEQAKSESKSTALLEQKRPNVFQMNVGHILPGDEIEVTLRYTETVVPISKIYEFVIPAVVGPRYSNSGPAADEAWVANPYLQEGKSSPMTFDIEVHLNAGMPLQRLTCDTHSVAINYTGPDSARVVLDDSESNAGNRDFVLRYRLAGDTLSSGMLIHEDENSGESFFLLTVEPPVRPTLEDIPAREYLFVLDTSGSMAGFPLMTAQELLKDLIGGLRTTDRFNVLFFAGSSSTLADQSLPATPANIKKAVSMIDRQRGGGGTELTAALKRAFALGGESGVSRSILVMTDGYVSFERETFEAVRENLNEANLFSFGIGSSVNRFCIEGLARAGQGEPFVVLDGKQAKIVAQKVKTLIESPILTDVKVDFGEFEIFDLEPPSIPDLFSDRPIQLTGKFRGQPEGMIRVTGVSGNRHEEIEIEIKTSSNRNRALPRLWARERIATLSDYLQLSESAEAKREVTNLGLTYGLLTRYTSFVAVDTVVRKAENLEHETVVQPLPLPKGVSGAAVGGGAVPEPSSALLCLIALAILLLIRQRRIINQA